MMHHLAWSATTMLEARWPGRSVWRRLDVGTTVTLRLPERLGTVTDTMRLRDALLFEDNIELEVHAGRAGYGRIRVIELPDHPFFLGTVFVPQLRSTPGKPRPLVSALVQAVVGALL